MKYRETTLLGRTDLGSAGTKTIDVNLLDPISRIDITFDVYLGSEKYTAQFGACIPKIELVDGSDVLFSMSGLECQALNIYNRKCPTMLSPYQNSGNYQIGTFAIDFGRYLYDPELALDPAKFRNLQLKITHDETAFGMAAGTNYMEVLASVFDEKAISPVGFLMGKNHYSYTPGAADAFQYIELPTDHALRQLLIRGFLEKKDPTTVVDEARLSEDNDKRVVLDFNLVRYRKRMQGVWTPIVEFWGEYAAIAAATYDRFFTPTSELTCALGASRTSFNAFSLEDTMRGGFMGWRGEDGVMFEGFVTGFLPNHCIQIPFGLAGELDSWYDVQNKGSVQLRLLSAADYSGAVVSVILEQLRRY